MPATEKARLITDSLKRILNLSEIQYNSVFALALGGIKQAAPVVQKNDSRISKGMQLRTILRNRGQIKIDLNKLSVFNL